MQRVSYLVTLGKKHLRQNNWEKDDESIRTTRNDRP